MNRRYRKKKYSEHALHIVDLAEKLMVKMWSDPDWAKVEANEIETPTGEVHLHWVNHRGRGHWNIIRNPKWHGEICNTVRCRKVIITPLGGENEAADVSAIGYWDNLERWHSNKLVEQWQQIDIRNTKQRIAETV